MCRRKIAFALSSVFNRQGVFALLDQSIVSMTNFITGVIIGRICGPEEMGLYSLAFTVMFFLLIIQESLIASPYMVYGPHLRSEERAKYLGSTLVHQLAISFIGVIVLALAGFMLLDFRPSEGIGTVLQSLSYALFFITTREYLRRIYFADLSMSMPLIFDTLASVIQLTALWILVRTAYLSAGAVYLATGLASGIVVALWALTARVPWRIQLRLVRQDSTQNWAFGKWLLLSSMLSSLTTFVYPWLLTTFHGTASAGLWAACAGLTALGNPIVIGMANFIGPRLTNAYANGGIQTLQYTTRISSVLSGVMLAPVVGLLVVVGGLLVARIYGDSYVGNGVTVALLALNMLVTALMFPFSRAIFALGRSDLDLRINLFSLAPLLTLAPILTQQFGVVGAACSLLAINIFCSIIRVVTLRSLYLRLL